MNKLLMKAVVVLTGGVVFAIGFLLGPAQLHLLSRFFSESTTPQDFSWRAAVTIMMTVVGFISFAIPGWIVGRTWPSGGWTWGLWLAVLPVVAQLELLLGEGVVYPLTLFAAMAGTVAGAITGAQLGSASRLATK